MFSVFLCEQASAKALQKCRDSIQKSMDSNEAFLKNNMCMGLLSCWITHAPKLTKMLTRSLLTCTCTAVFRECCYASHAFEALAGSINFGVLGRKDVHLRGKL